MAVKQQYIDDLVNIPGFSVCSVGTIGEEGDKALIIELYRKNNVYKCRCGREFTSRYDSYDRCLRDLSYGEWKTTYIVFFQARINCPECGVVTEHLEWVEPRVDYTKRLAAAVALSCREARSLKSIASDFGLHVHTVKKIDKQALQQLLPDTSEYSPRLIGVDEFSIKKRHHYGTTVVDLQTMEVPYVAEHRTKESLSGFYEAIGPVKCKAIKAVAMDMWKPYKEATRQYCPEANIVYDPFHIISAYGREVIDKTRTQEFKKAEGRQREILKGSRYLLLKNSDNLNIDKGEPARLSELLHLNKRLNTVYILKDDLKHLLQYRRPKWAAKWFKAWYNRAIRSGVGYLKKFARKLKRHLDGILSHCRYRIHTGFLEGVNNKIKVLKRVAYGYHDYEYLFLKIRGAFYKSEIH